MFTLSNKTLAIMAVIIAVFVGFLLWINKAESAVDPRPSVVLDAEADILRNQLTKEENRNCYKTYVNAERDNEDQVARLARHNFTFDWQASKAVAMSESSSSAAPLE